MWDTPREGSLQISWVRNMEVLDTLTVSEVMQLERNTLLDSEPLAVATEVFARTHHHRLPIVNESGELVGILTVQDVERVQSEDPANDR